MQNNTLIKQECIAVQEERVVTLHYTTLPSLIII